jgi:dihydrodipicolinate synthase
MEIFRGSGVAMITPMNEDFSIDYVAFRNLCELFIKDGVQALIVNGTTGESPTISDNEVCELVKIAVEVSNKRVPIIVGTGSNNTEHVVKLSLRVQELGIDGYLINTPYYNKTTQLGLIEHYTYIAEHVDLPIILYNVPGRTNLNIDIETVLALIDHPRIVAMKDASGDMNYTLKLLKKLNEKNSDFKLYSGEDWNILPFILSGGIGVISVLSNLYPAATQKYCDYALAGNIEKAQEMCFAFQQINEDLFNDVNPINIKTAMALKGLCKDVLRRPLVPTGTVNKEKLVKAIKELDNKGY